MHVGGVFKTTSVGGVFKTTSVTNSLHIIGNISLNMENTMFGIFKEEEALHLITPFLFLMARNYIHRTTLFNI